MCAKRNDQCHEIKSLVLKKVAKWTIFILKQGQVLKASAAPLAGIDPNFSSLPRGHVGHFWFPKKTNIFTWGQVQKLSCKKYFCLHEKRMIISISYQWSISMILYLPWFDKTQRAIRKWPGYIAEARRWLLALENKESWHGLQAKQILPQVRWQNSSSLFKAITTCPSSVYVCKVLIALSTYEGNWCSFRFFLFWQIVDNFFFFFFIWNLFAHGALRSS